MSDNILVTGSNGFVGTHLMEELIKNKLPNNYLIGTYRSDSKYYPASPEVIYERIDFNEIEAERKLHDIITRYNINTIYHLAAQPIISTAFKSPFLTFNTNIMAVLIVLEAARIYHVPNVVIMSTDKVFGEGQILSIHDMFDPKEPYNTSKICIEYIVQCYKRCYGMNITVVRCCNMIGFDLYNLTRIVPNIICDLLSNNVVKIHSPKSKRQYIDVEDAVKQIKDAKGKNQEIHIGSPYKFTAEEIATKICKIMEIDPNKALTLCEDLNPTELSLEDYEEIELKDFDATLTKIVQDFMQYFEELYENYNTNDTQ